MPRLSLWPGLLVVLLMLPGSLSAQDLSFSIGGGDSLSGTTVQLILLITVLSLAPGLLIMITAFPFLITVLSILRQAIGLQQSPPNMLMVSLALFLTWFVMEPVFSEAWEVGVKPMLDEKVETQIGLERAIEPFRGFMASRTELATFQSMAALRPDVAELELVPSAPLSVLVPSFMLSEIARAFQVGFLLFLPFLIIDLVVAAVLMSMGMMMVPPAIVSLPFKLAFFVVADGWSLIANALVRSYSG